MTMPDVLSEEDSLPNLNTCCLAGTVRTVHPLPGKTPGLSFVVRYLKHWPSGDTQEIGIPCYLTGQQRVEQASWVKPGEVVIVSGEVTDRGAIYAHRVQPWVRPPREPGADDEYLAGAQRYDRR
jgi:hypothetical protein